MESEEILDLQFSVHWSTCSSIPGSDFLSLDNFPENSELAISNKRGEE